MKKLTLLFALVAFALFVGQSQIVYDAEYDSNDTANYPYWIEMMQNPDINVFETVKAFNTYWEKRPNRKGSGYNPFKRWEWYMMHKMRPDGSRLADGHDQVAYQQYVSNLRSTDEFLGDWVNIGPIQLPSSPNPFWGNGRVNALAFHPTDADIFYIGAPSGGLWKTDDGGESWEPLTDGQPTLGVSSIVVNYDNPDIILVGSGDRDAGDAEGLGVYKSTDGGLTWDDTHAGMTNATVGRMIQHPDTPDVIFAATSNGIYKSTDLGENWSRKQTGSSKDILFKPDDPTIMYAVLGAKFYRSADSGETWQQINSGIPGAPSRAVIGVSADNPDYVYFFATGSSSFYGLYRSEDAGISFTTRSTSPNIMGWACNGGSGGQAWYDLDMAVDPLDAETIYGGGINCWKSTNGGQNWVMSSNQVGDCSAYPVHADLHVLEYNELDGRLYVGNDGGVWWTDNGGQTWNRITDGLAIGQQYKLGQSKLISNHVTTGYQDNGISTFHTDTWIQSDMYADGMESTMDNSDTTLGYGCAQYGRMYRRRYDKATNVIAGQNVGGITEQGNWVTPFCQHETDPNVMFAGYQSLWRTTNLQDTYPAWKKILSGSGSVTVVEHSPANENIFYFATSSGFYRSDNIMDADPYSTALGGRLPTSGTVRDIEAHPWNPDVVYIVQNMKVFKSVDKGLNWEDISGSLPEVSLNDIAYYDRGGIEGLYVASNIGVFFKDELMEDWVYYSDGLPAAILATEVEIYQNEEDPSLDRIRISSYGRGLWGSVPYYYEPVADFESSETNVPTGCLVDFYDRSSGYAQTWSWTFEGGTPSTSTLPNPTGILYDEEGVFEVTLIITNPAGTDTKTITEYITVSNDMQPIVNFMADDTVFCANGITKFTDLSQACPDSWEWSFEPDLVSFLDGTDKNSQNPRVEFTENGTYSVMLKVTNSAGESEMTKEDYISIGGLFLPFYEDFQNGLSLSALGWETVNPDGNMTWDITNMQGGDNQVAWVNIFDYPTLIARDYMNSPLLNFQGYDEVFMTFKYAYAQKYFQKDSLIVSVSGDCGATWERVFAGGPDGEGVFETAEPTDEFFEPQSTDDWCGAGYGAACPLIDLSKWAGQSNIKVRFETYANYGNNLYLTNIDISSTVGSIDGSDARSGSFMFYPNPTTGELNVVNFSEEEADLQILDIQGRLVKTKKLTGKQVKINVNNLSEGIYFIRFSNTSITKTRKLIIN